MSEYTGAAQLALAESLAGIIPTLYLEKADDAYYIAEVIVDSDWLTRVRVEAGAAALEAFADSKWGQRLRGRLIVDAELSIRERAAALRSALEGEHTEPTGETK